MTPDEARQLEITSRRGLSTALHPDLCQKLTLWGADFAVQPLKPPAATFIPVVSGDEVSVQVDVAEAADPELEAAADVVRSSAPITPTETCPTCGQPTGGELDVDLDAHQPFLSAAFGYVVRLLRKQYELTDAQIGQLLTFSGDSLPAWLPQVIRHAFGQDPAGGDDPMPFPPEEVYMESPDGA